MYLFIYIYIYIYTYIYIYIPTCICICDNIYICTLGGHDPVVPYIRCDGLLMLTPNTNVARPTFADRLKQALLERYRVRQSTR